MNLMEEIEKVKSEGYNEASAQARVCQDIILYGISKGSLSKNVTIKGGVVMRNISMDARRATQDIDLDFIRYSISDDSIEAFVKRLYLPNGLHILLKYPIVELNHKDYKGKRVLVDITDEYGNSLESKIDIGVHKNLDIEQEEYCFDICYLSDSADKDKLRECIQKYIYGDATLPVEDAEEIVRRIERVFTNSRFIKEINKSKKNWLDISTEETLAKDIEFVRSLQ